jgi:hypothetical protein
MADDQKDAAPIWTIGQVAYWEKVRARGRTQYVIAHFLAFCVGGALMLLGAWYFTERLQTDQFWIIVVMAAITPFAAAYIVVRDWNWYEREYLRSKAALENLENPPS